MNDYTEKLARFLARYAGADTDEERAQVRAEQQAFQESLTEEEYAAYRKASMAWIQTSLNELGIDTDRSRQLRGNATGFAA